MGQLKLKSKMKNWENPDRKYRPYKGCIYPDFSSKGKGSGSTGLRYVRGVGRVSYRRWVGEITYHHKRYRCRSTDLRKVERWLEDMRNKFNSIDFPEETKENKSND